MGAPGCDDAPIIDVELGNKPKDITVIYPYYENRLFLEEQIERWRKLPEQFRKQLTFLIVDDGSPDNPVKLQRILGLDLRFFRIDVDVRWNWLAARNIGAHEADSEWLLLTDIDHVVPEKTFEKLLFGRHDPYTIYRFSRSEHTGEKIHPHPNSWFMTKDMFWRVGGYDEALSGHYGTDGEYRRRCAATAKIRIHKDDLIRFEYVGDSSTLRYKRKQPEDAAAKKMIKARSHNWVPKTLSFPYHEL